MSNAPLPWGMDRYLLRLNEQGPYLSLHFVIIFVRDQERALRFYARSAWLPRRRRSTHRRRRSLD